MKERVILHSDLNNFYASVECKENSNLKNKPVAICGDESLRHGIVLAKNYIAKSYGIQTGDVIWQAKQKCPYLITITADFEKYLKYSALVRNIYEEYTDQIESFGIDECWLDCTNSGLLFGTGEQIAYTIKERIKKELGLTVSIGVSFNKVFAKLGSDIKKPDAITVINKNNYKEVVYPLPMENLLYVGRATYKKLSKIGLVTIGDIVKLEKEYLKKLMGKWGEYLYSFANGTENFEVKKNGLQSQIKSIGNSTTTPHDLIKYEEINSVISSLSQSVASRMRDYGLYGNTVNLAIRYNNLFSHGMQKKLKYFVANSIDIEKTAMALYKQINLNLPIRSLSVSVSNLKKLIYFQDDLFGDFNNSLKMQKLDVAIDKIRTRYGYQAIKPAINLVNKELENFDPKKENIIHPHGFFS